MNTGIIASRYAAALYKWVGADEAVAAKVKDQARTLVAALSLDKLRGLLKDASLSRKEKLGLLESALAPEAMQPQLLRFLELADSNGRISELRFILIAYVNLYHKEHNIHFAKLISATEPSEELRNRINAMTGHILGGTIVLEESTDPALIGGIVVEVDGTRYDASVRTALNTVKNEFAQQNKRII